jgi:hypothetical protein
VEESDEAVGLPWPEVLAPIGQSRDEAIRSGREVEINVILFFFLRDWFDHDLAMR